jgi:hypothetical protein
MKRFSLFLLNLIRLFSIGRITAKFLSPSSISWFLYQWYFEYYKCQHGGRKILERYLHETGAMTWMHFINYSLIMTGLFETL